MPTCTLPPQPNRNVADRADPAVSGPDEWTERQYAVNPLTHRGPVADEFVPASQDRQRLTNANHRGGGLSLRGGMEYLSAKGGFQQGPTYPPAIHGRRASGAQTHR